jgi:YjbE family integral membrane protein
MLDEAILLIKIIMVNIVLSGDNAIVIAMASQHLPNRERSKAVWWGTFGAIVLRVILSVMAIILLQIPWVQVIAALLLFYIAIKLLIASETEHTLNQGSTLFSVIWIIVIADLIMSLDNVLAIAAIAAGNWLYLVIGVTISIPLIIWGSGKMIEILQRYPAVIYIGSGILGYTAGDMLLQEQWVKIALTPMSHLIHWFIPIVGAILVISIGITYRIKRVR